MSKISHTDTLNLPPYGKAENLGILSTIHEINVPRFVVLRPNISEGEQTTIIQEFLRTYRKETVAVRSSASHEDSVSASFAGMYATKLHVTANLHDIQAAVEEVRASSTSKKEVVSHYTGHRSVALTDNYMSVIIQEMIDADTSGVIFSHDLSKADGYYTVSVSSGVGETIVGGNANGTLIRIARGVKPSDIRDAQIQQLVIAMKAIERQFRSSSLDVEFAFRNGILYILQCRHITTVQTTWEATHEEELLRHIESLNTSIASRFHGDVLGDMIDINPVELLGVSPTPLDISLFKYLFADSIVEQVRRDMGYDPLDTGLLRIVAGKPYASMRATAFSFRPLGIPDQVYERMVRVYRDALAENTSLQNRVEFDLYAMSCGDKLEKIMRRAHLSDEEMCAVRDAFLRIDTVFSKVSAEQATTFDSFASDYEQRTALIDDAPLSTILEHVARGTEMFVRVARLAFYWKNRFEELHRDVNLNELIAGHIQSINGQLQFDLVACREGKTSREELVRRYGHLRPGQFSVFGESYADDPDTYLFAQLSQAEAIEPEQQTHEFENATDFKNVVTFMQARERMKFLFSQSLHLFVTKLKRQLAQRGIKEGEAAEVDWSELDRCLRGSQRLAKKQGGVFPILLPDVIVPGMTDLRVVMFTEAAPSYITRSIVKARVCVLERLGVKTDVKGAIVLLPNADPGYDFLFHAGAVGIITKVGGPASHMCIRSIELRMPACIGCGENMYQKLVIAHSAVLDCGTQQIIVLD